jgi:hypothetical protein
VSLLAQFEGLTESGERRRADRRPLTLAITATVPQSPDLAATIHDLSETGFLLETHAPLTRDQPFELFLPLAGAVEASVVWRTEHFYGCQFRERVSRAAVSAALLKSVPRDGEGERPPQGLVEQLRDMNARVERLGEDLDRAIDDLSAKRPGPRPADPDAVIAAALPRSAIPLPPEPAVAAEVEPERSYEPAPANEADPARWVILVSLVLAGLAALILIAALLGLPLTT